MNALHAAREALQYQTTHSDVLMMIWIESTAYRRSAFKNIGSIKEFSRSPARRRPTLTRQHQLRRTTLRSCHRHTPTLPPLALFGSRQDAQFGEHGRRCAVDRGWSEGAGREGCTGERSQRDVETRWILVPRRKSLLPS